MTISLTANSVCSGNLTTSVTTDSELYSHACTLGLCTWIIMLLFIFLVASNVCVDSISGECYCVKDMNYENKSNVRIEIHYFFVGVGYQVGLSVGIPVAFLLTAIISSLLTLLITQCLIMRGRSESQQVHSSAAAGEPVYDPVSAVSGTRPTAVVEMKSNVAYGTTYKYFSRCEICRYALPLPGDSVKLATVSTQRFFAYC